jgi:hypothetical protein
LTVVLLALSMAVTVITQAITTVLNSRGRHLRRGLTDLLCQLDPALTGIVSKAIATEILTHPLVSGSAGPLAATNSDGITTTIRRLIGGARLGNVVHREEFTKLLMGVAAGLGSSQLPKGAQAALTTALTNNGVPDPAATLASIRKMALQLERAAPEVSHTVRQNAAILHAAETDLVAKINNWFDQTMDRTSQRFTASTRAITFAGAFLVAFGLQVDTVALVNRFAADDELRQSFVQEATALYTDQRGSTAATTPPDQEEMAQKYRVFLSTNGIITFPGLKGWWAGFRNINIFGVLLTALLLSLGAPFWYNALGQLLQLRSTLAVKDDAQRAERQLSAQAGGTPGSGSEPGTPLTSRPHHSS